MSIKAPEFPLGLKWINTKIPISLQELIKRPVLLNFCTFCALNCVHVLVDLKKLEQDFSHRGLVIINIYSPKFEHEKIHENVLDAIRKNKLQYPVLVDENMDVWRSYLVRTWPTLVLIDKEGNIEFKTSGEGHYGDLKDRIELLLKDSSLSKILLKEDVSNKEKSSLKYPNKIVQYKTESKSLYFVSDTFNNRILHYDERGCFLESFGEGVLNSPHGMCLFKDELYVCDSGNHRLLAFDIIGTPSRKYRWVAGRMELGFFDARSEYDAKQAPLNSPTDVCLWGENLIISCSGSHQIVKYKAKMDMVVHFAGSGYEDISDGNALYSKLAQPSGLCVVSENILAFTDSGTSALRLIVTNWNNTGKVQVVTLAGTGLFDFGFKDGVGAEALMQYPTSCIWSEDYRLLYVADTYNNALRAYSIDNDYLFTIPLSQKLNEPTGLAYYDGNLFITDSNAHRILMLREKDIPQLSDRNSACLAPSNVFIAKQFRYICSE